MSEQLTDQVLVERVQKGDQKAFNLLVVRYQHKVIVGVQHYNGQSETSQQPETPVFNTLPMMGKASPVSLGVPSEATANNGQQQQVQEQRRRINAMLQDYELQRRLHSEQLQFEQAQTQQAAVQVPGIQTLGTQSQ